jgi:putative transposase
MPRRPRFPVTGFPLHVVQRGNDRRACFFNERDYLVYWKALYDASRRYDVSVHAYVLMTNHVHLLVTPRFVGGVSRMMQSIGTRYVKYINASTGRTGTLWEGRYKACLVERDAHVLAACRYIDLNPVRAGLVRRPLDYRWSSHAALAGIRDDAVVTPHEALEHFGNPRGAAYGRWCALGIHENELARLRDAVSRELAFGSDEFRTDIETRTARSTFARPGGRPKRAA